MSTPTTYELPQLSFSDQITGDQSVLSTVPNASLHTEATAANMMEQLCHKVDAIGADGLWQNLLESACEQTGFGPILDALTECAGLL